MEALEAIEVAIRVDMAYYLGMGNTFAHEDPNLLDAKFTRPGKNGAPSQHQDWLAKLAEYTDRSREEFVSHFKARYGTPLPIWVSIEVWDFGLLSRFYAGMSYATQLALCQRFGVGRPDVMASWLRTLNYVRNIVAHHCRLWNRNMIDQPKLPRLGEIVDFDGALPALNVARPYTMLCIVAYLLKTCSPRSSWAQRAADHLDHFPAVSAPGVDIGGTGAITGWRAHIFWQ
jgi:abortive infection bacteriophage resistance protein